MSRKDDTLRLIPCSKTNLSTESSPKNNELVHVTLRPAQTLLPCLRAFHNLGMPPTSWLPRQPSVQWIWILIALLIGSYGTPSRCMTRSELKILT